MHIVIAILCTLVLIPSVIFMTNNDVNGKNAVVQKKEPIWINMKMLMKDRDFLLASFSHAMAITYFEVFTTVIGQMISVYGFTPRDASYLGSAFLFPGVVSGVLCSVYLTKAGTKAFKPSALVLMALTIASKFDLL